MSLTVFTYIMLVFGVTQVPGFQDKVSLKEKVKHHLLEMDSFITKKKHTKWKMETEQSGATKCF